MSFSFGNCVIGMTRAPNLKIFLRAALFQFYVYRLEGLFHLQIGPFYFMRSLK